MPLDEPIARPAPPRPPADPPPRPSIDAAPEGGDREIPRLPPGVVLNLPVSFTARPEDYARLWWRNLILILLTAGLYLPWARVSAQRFFMRHTHVAGHRLDYHATGASVSPRYALCLSLLVGVVGAGVGSRWAGMAALSLALAVWPLLVYMSLVHRMAHISWAGRRLSFDGGCAGVYGSLWPPLLGGGFLAWALMAVVAWCQPAGWLAWALAVGLWLLAVPTFLAVWLLYRQGHLRLGPLGLHWQADRPALRLAWGRTLFWAFLVSSFMLGLGACVVGVVVLRQGHLSVPGVSLTVGVCAAVMAAVVGANAQARLQNLVWRRTGCRHLRFRSQLSVSRYVALQVRNLFCLVLTAGLYWPWAVVASRRLRCEALMVWTRVDADVLKAHWPTHESVHRAGQAPGPSMSSLHGSHLTTLPHVASLS